MFGNLAAATSTGGMTNKLPGRVGGSPLVGAGCYANNASVAVSCTGTGEVFIRALAAYDIAALMDYGGLDLSSIVATLMEKFTNAWRQRRFIALLSIMRAMSLCRLTAKKRQHRAWGYAGDTPTTRYLSGKRR